MVAAEAGAAGAGEAVGVAAATSKTATDRLRQTSSAEEGSSFLALQRENL